MSVLHGTATLPGLPVLFHPSVLAPMPFFFFFKKALALAGVAQWIECQPANQGVTGSIPSQGTCLGCGPGPP